tara:strand:+ start:6295 stop:7224 length:930 start_codon:yes stop_codon:yes gene_type:complete
MKKIFSFIAIIIFYLWNFETVSSEIFIKAKINNQILTNFDVKNEKNYLLALNPSLRNLSSEEINQYATDSLINENIKRIEIEKRYEIIQNKKMINKVIKDIYSGLDISNINEFEQYLDKYSINLGLVKKKISIEIAWNDYIFNKFNRSILIDENKIRDKISKLSKQNKIENILLSEIIFTINDKESLESKFNNIKDSVNKIGFEETAKIYSVSDSKKKGGKIGWVYKTQLSKKILNEIEKIDVGQLTKPITTPGGFILLKLNDKKDEILNIDEEEQFKKAVNFEKNRQLTIYSTLLYKRVYNKSVINEF